jgi:DNA-binding transcriptional MerR regulator
MDPDRQTVGDKFDDEHYPAYTMGGAAELLGVTQSFLRSLDEAKLIDPRRSPGGHRRYSRYQLRVAARARELVDHGIPLDAACRIVILEDQLQEAMRINAEHRRGEKRTASESPRHDRAQLRQQLMRHATAFGTAQAVRSDGATRSGGVDSA